MNCLSTSVLFAFVLTVSFVFGQKIGGQRLVPQIAQDCLDCICYASSDCNVFTCHNAGAGAYFCGPYQVSYNYWSDGGRPGANPNDKADFEKCLNDKACAEKAVIGYMQKWGGDCNNDGLVDCDDYARIHKAGPYGCNGTWTETTKYWKKFDVCYYEQRHK